MSAIKKIILLNILLIMPLLQAFSQQASLFNQQYKNMYMLNPAYAGSEGIGIMHLHYRKQWMGFDNAPETMAASFHTPINGKNYALGVSVIRLKEDILSNSGLRGTYAYRADIGDSTSITFGLSAGAIFQSIDFGELSDADQIDPVLSVADGAVSGDANFGALLRYRELELGFSTYYLFSAKRDASLNSFSNKLFSHTLLNASFSIQTPNPSLILKPLVVYRFATAIPGQFDFNLIAEWNEQFWASIGHRTEYGFLVSAGLNIKEHLSIGYGFENSRQGIGMYGNNSHEIMISYKFNKRKPKSQEIEERKDTEGNL